MGKDNIPACRAFLAIELAHDETLTVDVCFELGLGGLVFSFKTIWQIMGDCSCFRYGYNSGFDPRVPKY
jgi:hypothetical protein